MRKIGSRVVIAVMALMLASSCFAGSAFAAGSSAPAYDSGSSGADAWQSEKKPLIGKRTAKLIALDDAGVKKKRCSDISVDLRRRSGKKVYIVRFTHKHIMEYRYTIGARSGKVLAYYAKHV